MRTKFDIYVLLEPVTVTEDENHVLVEDCQVLAPDFFNEKIIKLKEIKSKPTRRKEIIWVKLYLVDR